MPLEKNSMLSVIDLKELAQMRVPQLQAKMEAIYKELPEGINPGLNDELKNKALAILQKAGIESGLHLENGCRFIHCVVRSGHVELFKALVSLGFDIKIKDNHEKGLLCYAAQWNQVPIFQELLANRLDPHAEKNLFEVASKNIHLLEILKGCGFNMNAKDGDSRGLLDYLNFSGSDNAKIIEKLITNNWLDINSSDKNGKGILFCLLRNDVSIDTFRALIAKGLDINAQFLQCLAPPYCNRGFYNNGMLSKAIIILVNEGLLDVHLRNKEGFGFLHYLVNQLALPIVFEAVAAKGLDLNGKINNKGFLDYISFRSLDYVNGVILPLVAKGLLDESISDEKGNGLSYYSYKNLIKLETTKLIVQPQYDIHLIDKEGRGVLYYLIKDNASIETYKKLISQGLNLNAQDGEGSLFLANLNKFNSLEIHRYCIQLNAALISEGLLDINIKNVWGEGLLHYAVKFGQMDLVKMLIAKGLDAHAEDVYGNNVLSLAPFAGNCTLLIKFLINEYGVKPDFVKLSRVILEDKLTFGEIYDRYLFSCANSVVISNADSDVIFESNHYLSPIITKDLAKIVQSYLLYPTPKELERLEEIVEQRKALLKPLRKYCKTNPLNNKAMVVLNSLWATLKLGVPALQKVLENLLAEEPQNYHPSLVQCRLNAITMLMNQPAIITPVSLIEAPQDPSPNVIESRINPVINSQPLEQNTIKPKQQANESPVASYALQLKWLQTLAAGSLTIFLSGLIAVSLNIPIGFAVALLAVGVAGGLAACGFYRQRQKVNLLISEVNVTSTADKPVSSQA